jgi:YbbR domain-containing protein
MGWKLLSVGVAVLLWVLVASEPELSTFVTAPVQFKDMPEGLEISSGLLEAVNLELRGPSGELNSLEEGRAPSVVIDMSLLDPGEHTFTIGTKDVRLPGGVKLVRAFPSQLRFKFERSVSATVPVEVRFGRTHNGYEVAGFEVEPRTLRIVGPESRVSGVKAVTTDPLDLSQVVGSARFNVSAFVEDAQVRFAAPPRVTVSVQVRARPEPRAGR